MSSLIQKAVFSCGTGTILKTLQTGQKRISPLAISLRKSGVISASSQIRFAATGQVAGTDKYSKHWTAERVMSLALLGVIPAAFAYPTPALDCALALSAVIHSHWGVEAIVVDYVRPKIFGETIPKVAVALVYGLSAITLGGLLYFNYTDVGIVHAVKMLWSL